jgi:hypothetical protein
MAGKYRHEWLFVILLVVAFLLYGSTVGVVRDH